MYFLYINDSNFAFLQFIKIPNIKIRICSSKLSNSKPNFFTTFAQNSFARIFHITPNLVTLLARKKSILFKLLAAVEHFESVVSRPFGINFRTSVKCPIVDLFTLALSRLKGFEAAMIEHGDWPTRGQQESIIAGIELLVLSNLA